MIEIDVNILLYAYDSSSPFHQKARAWLEKTLSSDDLVGIPWQNVIAFLRIVTNPRLPGRRFTLAEAIRIVESWLDQPNVRMLAPGEEHWPILSRTLTEGQATGPLISDGSLAALAIEHGAVLYTTDRDFARFPGLRWSNPLA
jgi:uncharacterized protein